MQNQHAVEINLDEDLVARAKEGDNAAFTQLVERYQNSCLKLAVSILKDRQDAEDEVQNACWKAFQHIGQFQGDAKFSTWLTRIVVNQCLMRMRQYRRVKLVYFEDAVGEDSRVLDLPSPTISPENELGTSQISKVLQKEISRIPPLLRSVFLLRDVEEMPMEEVARRLGISVAAAKSRLLRARVELRERLRKHEGRLGPATLMA